MESFPRSKVISITKQARQRQSERRREVSGFSSKSLVRQRTIAALLLVFIAALSRRSDIAVVSCAALAFDFSSRAMTGISPRTTSTRNSCWGQTCRISGRIRNCGCGNDGYRIGRTQRPQNPFRQNFKQGLYSTTEKSANGDLAAAAKSLINATVESKSPLREKKSNTTKDDKQCNNNNHRHQTIPRHVGLICDGNGRWATQKNLPRAAGHLEGARRLVDLIRSLVRERSKSEKQQNKHGRSDETDATGVDSSGAVSCLTLYAFSTENWNRSPSEITKIFEAIEFAATLVKNSGDISDVDIRVLGDLSDDRIPASLRKVLSDLEDRTRIRNRNNNNKQGGGQQQQQQQQRRLEVCLAVNYGGRRDIVSACRAMAEAVKDGTIETSEITEDTLQSNLATRGMPPPDLIVRTGGEHRLSNFLLWEAAYAELYVSQVLWPDFSWEGEWLHSLDWYSKRKRNFGGRND